jgi:molybdate transport system permease protein
MMSNRHSWGFFTVIAIALAFSLGIILAILFSQLGYTGIRQSANSFLDPGIRQAILLSLVTATGSALLALVVGIPAAYGLARYRFPGSLVVDVLIDLPIVLSPVAVGLSMLLFFRSGMGQWIEGHLIRFVFEIPGIILAQFIVALALTIRVLKAVFQNIDKRYEQVASFLGCTPWQAFRKVTLPLAGKGIMTAFILAWARSMGEFGATVTLAGAVPGKTETIPVAIYLRMARVDITGAVSLMIVLSFISLLVLLSVRVLVGRHG